MDSSASSELPSGLCNQGCCKSLAGFVRFQGSAYGREFNSGNLTCILQSSERFLEEGGAKTSWTLWMSAGIILFCRGRGGERRGGNSCQHVRGDQSRHSMISVQGRFSGVPSWSYNHRFKDPLDVLAVLVLLLLLFFFFKQGQYRRD